MSTTTEDKKDNSIILEEPIVRGEQTITELHFRKPKSGELRGLSLTDILNLDVNALQTLLPRITVPTITKQEVERMDVSDLLQAGAKVADFLVPKSLKDGSPIE